MKARSYRPGFVGPLILIAVGVLLLLNQMGRLPWSFWGAVWRFWPVIFVLIGLEILVGVSRSRVLYAVGVLVAIVVLGAVIGYGLLWGGQTGSQQPVAGRETLSEAMQDADRGQVGLRFGAGTLRVGALRDSPGFFEGDIEYARSSGRVEKHFDVRNGRAELQLQAGPQSTPLWSPGDESRTLWDIRLTPRIPLELEIDTGVGRAEIDLRDLKVTRFDLKAGVGQVTVTCPADAGVTQGTIKAGVGEITVRLPDGVGARIQVSRGLGSIRADGRRFDRSGDEYTTGDYRSGANRIELEISAGIGGVVLE